MAEKVPVQLLLLDVLEELDALHRQPKDLEDLVGALGL